ncbi:MAG: PEGA domain-containing protein, partial [Archangium sp.]|nr:PEGA domain-containing protein [Archangium sp.]
PPVEVPLNVTVRTTPTGAEVIENDVVIGTTPLTTSWKRNASRVFRFRSKGFVELAKTLRPEGDQTFDFSLEAVPAPTPLPVDDKGKKPKRKGDDIEAFE